MGPAVRRLEGHLDRLALHLDRGLSGGRGGTGRGRRGPSAVVVAVRPAGTLDDLDLIEHTQVAGEPSGVLRRSTPSLISGSGGAVFSIASRPALDGVKVVLVSVIFSATRSGRAEGDQITDRGVALGQAQHAGIVSFG